MPYVEIKTPFTLPLEKKKTIRNRLVESFAETSSPKIANNLMVTIIDNCYVNLQESETAGCVSFQPGGLTKPEEWDAIVGGFTKVLAEEIPELNMEHTYMPIIPIGKWGFHGHTV